MKFNLFFAITVSLFSISTVASPLYSCTNTNGKQVHIRTDDESDLVTFRNCRTLQQSYAASSADGTTLTMSEKYLYKLMQHTIRCVQTKSTAPDCQVYQ